MVSSVQYGWSPGLRLGTHCLFKERRQYIQCDMVEMSTTTPYGNVCYTDELSYTRTPWSYH